MLKIARIQKEDLQKIFLEFARFQHSSDQSENVYNKIKVLRNNLLQSPIQNLHSKAIILNLVFNRQRNVLQVL